MIRFFFRLLLLPLLALLVVGPSPLWGEAQDIHTQMLRATVKISHKDSTATGFVLTPDNGKSFILVTAHHVLDKIQSNEASIIFRSLVSEGEYHKQPTKLIIRKDDKPLWAKHPTEDVAAISVTPPKDADLALISTTCLATEEILRETKIHPGQQSYLLGYPHREEASEAGFPILRSGPIATYPLLPTQKTKTFYLSTPIFSGDSGGPVYTTRDEAADPSAQDEPLILGVVHGQRFVNDTIKGNYITVKTHHQFGLAIIVHASFIVETIALMK